MAIDFLLQKANEHMEKAISYEEDGELKKAKDRYLKASEYLFKAAKESEGEMKEVRMINADKLLKKAESIKIPKRQETHKTDKASIRGEDDEDMTEWIPAKQPKVNFNDVAGLDQVKEEIKMKLIYPFTHPEKAQHYDIGSGGGILLYGPPGTGKTYIAKATANEVDAMFFSIKPSEIMSQWVGVAEKNIAKLFSVARAHDRSVIFIDEVESLIPKRRRTSSTVMKRLIPQILAELDGLDSSNENLLFIGATNEPWALDHAVLRPGRFDARIYVPPPDQRARKKIFELNVKKKPISDEVNLDELAILTEGYSGADIRLICIKASTIPFMDSITIGSDRDINMDDFIKVIGEIKPSISKKMVQEYERYTSSG